MLRDERLRDRKAQSAAAFAAGDERKEDPVAQVIGHAGTVVLDGDVERQPIVALRQRDTAHTIGIAGNSACTTPLTRTSTSWMLMRR